MRFLGIRWWSSERRPVGFGDVGHQSPPLNALNAERAEPPYRLGAGRMGNGPPAIGMEARRAETRLAGARYAVRQPGPEGSPLPGGQASW